MSGIEETTPEVVLDHEAVTVRQLRTPELGDSTYIVTSGLEADRQQLSSMRSAMSSVVRSFSTRSVAALSLSLKLTFTTTT